MLYTKYLKSSCPCKFKATTLYNDHLVVSFDAANVLGVKFIFCPRKIFNIRQSQLHATAAIKFLMVYFRFLTQE